MANIETKNISQGDIEVASNSITETAIYIDEAAEKSYRRKIDTYILPFMALMYLCNSVDRSNLANAYTDGFATDMHFVGQEYSLLLLLFYIPNGFLDLPLNLLTKRYGARWMLSGLCLLWGIMSMLQAAAKNFAGMLVLRLFIGGLEAGFFAGTVFYFTLFYKRNELGFRLALFFGSAQVAAAFSGLLAFGVFHIKSHIQGWQWLFLIEGGLTVIVGAVAFWWLPSTPADCRFLTEAEKAVARSRMLKDASVEVSEKFSFKQAMSAFRGWRAWAFVLISFTYAGAFSTTSSFLPQIVQRLGFSTIKTNLWTVAPNCVGVVVLLCVTWSSDHFRERTFHLAFALLLPLVGMIILATINVLHQKGVAYFAMFLMAAGAYIPSCLVHTWHNSNNLHENSRAAMTGIYVGIGNLAGIMVAATFRTNYAPAYLPTIYCATASSAVCLVTVLSTGIWMKLDNRKRDKAQGVHRVPGQIDTAQLGDGDKSPDWRWSS